MDQRIVDFLENLMPLARSLGIGLLILIFGWIAGKWANRLTIAAFSRKKLDEALGKFLASIIQYAILAATVIAALASVGIQTTGLLAIFASAGLAIGLALQGSLSNFASGVMLLFFRPFTLGDRVSTAGHTGKVMDIGIFTTSLLTPSNEKIIIPNSSVWGSSIVNFTSEQILRGAVDVGVAYGSDVGKVMEVLQKAAASTELVLAEPAPGVVFAGLGASSLDFKVAAWSKSADHLPMLHNLRRSVYEALNEAEIEIPFNQLVIHKA